MRTKILQYVAEFFGNMFFVKFYFSSLLVERIFLNTFGGRHKGSSTKIKIYGLRLPKL